MSDERQRGQEAVKQHLISRRSRLVVFGRIETSDGLIVYADLTLVTGGDNEGDPTALGVLFQPDSHEVKFSCYSLANRSYDRLAAACHADISDSPDLEVCWPELHSDHLVVCNQRRLISVEHPQMLQILFGAYAQLASKQESGLMAMMRRLRALIDQVNQHTSARHSLPS